MTKLIVAYDKSEFTGTDNRILKGISCIPDLMIKVGSEAMTAFSGSASIAYVVNDFCQRLASNKERVPIFWDQKLCDIEHTVERTVRNIVRLQNVRMFTIMASVSEGALRAAANICREKDVIPLAVTVLTDLDGKECKYIFGEEPDLTVLRFARRAQECGIRGLVCSTRELPYLQQNGIENMFFVVPGIRLPDAPLDDQKRTVTPRQAARLGAHHIVVGRPIMESPDPVAAAWSLHESLH